MVILQSNKKSLGRFGSPGFTVKGGRIWGGQVGVECFDVRLEIEGVGLGGLVVDDVGL